MNTLTRVRALESHKCVFLSFFISAYTPHEPSPGLWHKRLPRIRMCTLVRSSWIWDHLCGWDPCSQSVCSAAPLVHQGRSVVSPLRKADFQSPQGSPLGRSKEEPGFFSLTRRSRPGAILTLGTPEPGQTRSGVLGVPPFRHLSEPQPRALVWQTAAMRPCGHKRDPFVLKGLGIGWHRDSRLHLPTPTQAPGSCGVLTTEGDRAGRARPSLRSGSSCSGGHQLKQAPLGHLLLFGQVQWALGPGHTQGPAWPPPVPLSTGAFYKVCFISPHLFFFFFF